MTLSGVDLSSHNTAAEFAAALKERDFAICKATEGVSYLNPTLAKFLVDWRAAGKLLGTYHFARPSNSPLVEADWYVTKAAPLPGEVLVLDFEPYNQTTVEAQWGSWVVAWLKRVKELTSTDAWIYLNQDMATRVRRVATAAEWAYITARPLWKASYTDDGGRLARVAEGHLLAVDRHPARPELVLRRRRTVALARRPPGGQHGPDPRRDRSHRQGCR